MLKLLTLVSALGLAAAEKCEDFSCTAAIAGGVQGANVQQVSTMCWIESAPFMIHIFLFSFINMY